MTRVDMIQVIARLDDLLYTYRQSLRFTDSTDETKSYILMIDEISEHHETLQRRFGRDAENEGIGGINCKTHTVRLEQIA